MSFSYQEKIKFLLPDGDAEKLDAITDNNGYEFTIIALMLNAYDNGEHIIGDALRGLCKNTFNSGNHLKILRASSIKEVS